MPVAQNNHAIFIQAASALTQAISTMVLVGITAYYAWQTRQTVKEAENTRKDSRLPILRIEIQGPIMHDRASKSISVSVENIGYGLARNITVKFPNRESFPVENLNIGEKADFSFSLNSFDEDKTINALPKSDKVIFTKYDDIFGREISSISNFDNTETRNNWIVFDVVEWQPILPK